MSKIKIQKVKDPVDQMNLELKRMCQSMENFISKELKEPVEMDINSKKKLNVFKLKSKDTSTFHWEINFNMESMDKRNRPDRHFVIKNKNKKAVVFNINSNSQLRFIFEHLIK